MSTGTIKKLVRDRGFGFIEEPTGQDIFFHASGVQGIPFDELEEGEMVEYDAESDTKGRGQRAVNVRLGGTPA
ncbi:MAG TPA: cold shock domain-containing protein [Chloroflexota bacterium]|nr:cold shock domain-containing protein [Chloroflexota bacterium]